MILLVLIMQKVSHSTIKKAYQKIDRLKEKNRTNQYKENTKEKLFGVLLRMTKPFFLFIIKFISFQIPFPFIISNLANH